MDADPEKQLRLEYLRFAVNFLGMYRRVPSDLFALARAVAAFVEKNDGTLDQIIKDL